MKFIIITHFLFFGERDSFFTNDVYLSLDISMSVKAVNYMLPEKNKYSGILEK